MEFVIAVPGGMENSLDVAVKTGKASAKTTTVAPGETAVFAIGAKDQITVTVGDSYSYPKHEDPGSLPPAHAS